MSDERPDEFFSWRSRLSPPDALPEQGLDNRDLTWEKLAPRLQHTQPTRLQSTRLQSAWLQSARLRSAWLRSAQLRSTHRRLPVYRLAAACLLLLLVPAALLFHNRPTHTTRQPIITTSPQPGTISARPAPLTRRPAEASPILRSGPTPKELARLRPIHPAPTATPPAQTPNPPASTITHTLPPQTPAAKPQDSLLQPVPVYADLVPAPVLLQNKLKTNQLRIVHVNELDSPTNPAPAMTSIRDREPDIRALIILKNH